MSDLIGQTVEWKSRLYEPVKRGVVIGLIPALKLPAKLFPELVGVAKNRIKLGYGIYDATRHDRYLIRVDRTHAITGAPLEPYYYAPTCSTIDATQI